MELNRRFERNVSPCSAYFLLLADFLLGVVDPNYGVNRLCGLVSESLATVPEVWVRFRALPDFLKNSGPGTGLTQPREYN
jgi:hypothetical protein